MSVRVRRIIKNTGFLYFRMMLTISISLYTSRILLNTLGADDFGLYHVVAGFVILAGFMQGALSGTTQRFIAFELGKSESSYLATVFNMSLNIHIIFAGCVLILGGVLGTLLIPSILTFNEARISVVFFIFWTALLSFIISIIVVPFHAMIIAHEEMKVFAWVSIAQAIFNLGVVFLIQYLPYDPLASYGALMFLVTFSIGLIYFTYVSRKYNIQILTLHWDHSLFKRLVSFSGWTIWGSAATVFSNYGTNILLNVFFGPVVNAAKSIGNQASGALNQFVSNLQMAINPQIIKSYSANDKGYTNKLINYGSKYNFFLIFTLALPVIIRTEDILNAWLVNPPDYSVIFLRLILINLIMDSVSRPLITVAQATGDIKLYQFVVGGVLLLNLPLSYLTLRLGYSPVSVFWVAIGLTLLAALARILMLKRIFKFSFLEYLKISIFRILMVSAISFILMSKASQLCSEHLNVIELLIFSLSSVLVTVISIWFFGLERNERNMVINILDLKRRLKKMFK